jgi:glycerol kinase
LTTGFFGSLDAVAKLGQEDREFRPMMQATESEHLYAGWLEAVKRVL